MNRTNIFWGILIQIPRRFLLFILTATVIAFITIGLAQISKAGLAPVTFISHNVSVTYTKDIAPILFQNCATCHRPGQIAPFSLMTYQEAVKQAKSLASSTASRSMPPWKPVPGYGEFQGERRLTDEQIALFQKWADTGAKKGNSADLPPIPKFTEGWQLGTPDLTFEMPKPYTLQPDGSDVYQCFVLPFKFSSDRYISAIEIKPGNSRIVHHSTLHQIPSQLAENIQADNQKDKNQVGYECFGDVGRDRQGKPIIAPNIGAWVPGRTTQFLPDGMARVIKKDSQLILQNHYHRNGQKETDQTVVGIYFSKTPPQKMLQGVPLLQVNLAIPAGEKSYKTTASYTLPVDFDIVQIIPHMHWLGKQMKVTATLPDGTVKPMIWIKDWDFDWQDQYQYKKPVHLPQGTKLEMEAIYDNSEDNPRNPNNPPKLVTWGEQTTDEMALCGIQIAVALDDQQSLDKVKQLQQRIRTTYLEYLERHHPSEPKS